ncbi:hypothetical protein M422DRAFT_213217, partial [Sphaerobolus stellatus SS14]
MPRRGRYRNSYYTPEVVTPENESPEEPAPEYPPEEPAPECPPEDAWTPPSSSPVLVNYSLPSPPPAMASPAPSSPLPQSPAAFPSRAVTPHTESFPTRPPSTLTVGYTPESFQHQALYGVRSVAGSPSVRAVPSPPRSVLSLADFSRPQTPISRLPSPSPGEFPALTAPSTPRDVEDPLPPPVEVPVIDEDYYHHEGVVFLVEGGLAKVPRYMLINESDNFEQLYSLPSVNSRGPGTSDDNPLVLDDVKAVDFIRLLNLLYPKTLGMRQTIVENWEEDEWVSILTLSTKWAMREVRKLAITHLTKCASSVSKILLGKKFLVIPWIRQGYLELCLHPEPLTESEGERLGWKEVVRIAKAR